MPRIGPMPSVAKKTPTVNAHSGRRPEETNRSRKPSYYI